MEWPVDLFLAFCEGETLRESRPEMFMSGYILGVFYRNVSGAVPWPFNDGDGNKTSSFFDENLRQETKEANRGSSHPFQSRGGLLDWRTIHWTALSFPLCNPLAFVGKPGPQI